VWSVRGTRPRTVCVCIKEEEKKLRTGTGTINGIVIGPAVGDRTTATRRGVASLIADVTVALAQRTTETVLTRPALSVVGTSSSDIRIRHKLLSIKIRFPASVRRLYTRGGRRRSSGHHGLHEGRVRVVALLRGLAVRKVVGVPQTPGVAQTALTVIVEVATHVPVLATPLARAKFTAAALVRGVSAARRVARAAGTVACSS